MEKDTIQIMLEDYTNAPEGSLLIKKGDKFVPISYDELSRKERKKIKELEEISSKIDQVNENIGHFKLYSKRNFLIVFNAFKIKVLGGELDESNPEIINLDVAVLEGKISVKDAVEKNDYIKYLFNELFINSGDKIKEI